MKKMVNVIEVSSSVIRVVHSEINRGVASICGYEEMDIKGSSDEEIVTAFRNTSFFKRVFNQRNVLLFSGSLIMTRQTIVPSQEEKEVATIIDLEMKGGVPYPSQDIIHDHIILNRREDGFSRVLLAIMRKAIFERFFSVFRKAGILIDQISITPLYIARFICEHKRVFGLNSRPFLLIYVDPGKFQLLFIENEKLYLYRSVLAIERVPNKEYKGFIDEVHLALKTYIHNKIGSLPQKIAIICDQDINIEHDLEQKTRIGCVRIDPLDINLLRTINNTKMFPCRERRIPFYFSLVETSGQCEDAALFRKYLNECMPTGKHILIFVKVAVCSLVIAFFLLTLFWVKTFLKQEELDKVSLRNAGIQEYAGYAKEITKLSFLLKEGIRNRPLFKDIVNELNNVMPQDVFLDFLEVKNNKAIILEGKAKDNSAINTFQANLIRSVLFNNVEYVSSKLRQREQLTDFEIKAELSEEDKQNEKDLP